MPGIAGILGKGPPAWNRGALDDMIQRMRHEPYYATGTYVNEALGLWVGWADHGGLAVERRPQWNESGDIGLILSGEHVEDPADEAALRARGHTVVPDTSPALVHWYEEEGVDCLKRLNGRFSGVLIDCRLGQAILFNDRYGLGRLYYHENRERIVFASEAKALLRVLPELRAVDPDRLAEFFACGCPLRGQALYAGMALLPAGAAWTIAPGEPPRRGVYFRREEWENLPALATADYYRALKDTFARIVPRYLKGAERVGMSLTGGVDSRMVMAWLRQAPGTLPCYTFGGMFRDCIDVTMARRVAQLCGQPHHVIEVGRDFIGQFPELAARTVYLTDGAMDVSGAPDLYVNRIARSIAPVRLTGNYGGEILRSIVAFKPMALNPALFDGDFVGRLGVAASVYRAELEARDLAFVAFKQVPWHHYARLSLEQCLLTIRSPYLDNALVALAFQAPAGADADNVLSLRLIADGLPSLGNLGTDRGVKRKGIPVVTALGHAFQEFTFKAEYAYDYGMPDWLARIDSTLGGLQLHRLFLGRHKFYHFRLWYRDQLAPFVKEVLLDPRTLGRSFFSRKGLEAAVARHTSGRGNCTLEIHRALSCELMHRQLLESA